MPYFWYHLQKFSIKINACMKMMKLKKISFIIFIYIGMPWETRKKKKKKRPRHFAGEDSAGTQPYSKATNLGTIVGGHYAV